MIAKALGVTSERVVVLGIPHPVHMASTCRVRQFGTSVLLRNKASASSGVSSSDHASTSSAHTSDSPASSDSNTTEYDANTSRALDSEFDFLDNVPPDTSSPPGLYTSRSSSSGFRQHAFSESYQASTSSTSSQPLSSFKHESLTEPDSTWDALSRRESERRGQPLQDAAQNEAVRRLWESVPRALGVVRPDQNPRSTHVQSLNPARSLKGTQRRQRRSEGQTPHEGRALDSLLSRMLRDLNVSTGKHIASDGAGAFGALGGTSSGLGSGSGRGNGASTDWRTVLSSAAQNERAGLGSFRAANRRGRKEDMDPVVAEAVDRLVEELSMLRSAADVVAWAEENVLRPINADTSSSSLASEPSSSSPSTSSTTGASGDAIQTPEISMGVRPIFDVTYPRVLAAVLNALRRLNAPHAALALFEHARTSSPESYLSGCQTSAYNELLAVRWQSFRDLRGVYAGVREMEVNGVAWDRRTASTVGGVVDAVARELLGRSGPGAAARWGDGANEILAELEKRVTEDTRREDAKYERMVWDKRSERTVERNAARNDQWVPTPRAGGGIAAFDRAR